MARSSAEQHHRYRAHPAGTEPPRVVQSPRDRRAQPHRWADPLAEFRDIQTEYQERLEEMREALEQTRAAELLDEVGDLDLDSLDSETPTGLQTRLTSRGRRTPSATG